MDHLVGVALQLETGPAICTQEQGVIMVPGESSELLCALLKLNLPLFNFVENCNLVIPCSLSVGLMNLVDENCAVSKDSELKIIVWVERCRDVSLRNFAFLYIET